MGIIIDGRGLTDFEEESCIINNEYVNFTLTIGGEFFRISTPLNDFKRSIKYFPNKTTSQDAHFDL